MKKFNLLKLIALPTIVGIMLSLSFCKKDTETVTNTVTVHDTLTGKSILGNITYPDANNVSQLAKGAVVTLYVGSTVDPTKIAGTAFADANGNYTFPYLLPGTYTINAQYNTVNQNARQISDGFNFGTNPAVTVTLGSSNLTQNIVLVNIGSSGSAKISFLPVGDSIPGYRLVTFETHSKIDFSFPDNSNKGTSSSTTNSGINVTGGFNKFQMDSTFVFDEANPQNTVISGWTLLSSSNTFEPTRDAMGLNLPGSGLDTSGAYFTTGCTHGTMDDYMDSAKYYSNPPYTPNVAIPGVDTARFTCTAGHCVRYGDGYVAHGVLTAFYHHLAPGPIAGMADGNYQYASDTTGFFAKNGFACPVTQDGMISIPVDMYFIYSKVQINLVPSGYNWWFNFQGQFSFKPLSQAYLVSNGHLGDSPLTVTVNVNFFGEKSVPY